VLKNDMNIVGFRGKRKKLKGGDAWELTLKEARSLHVL
jgi:hypothetical protein